jgi:hypothetical protein
MTLLSDVFSGFCGESGDDYDDDEIDFCGMPSDQIVEIAIRRDFLLLRLQELVDAETREEAEAAVVAMEKEASRDLLKFLVRAGTVEIIRGCSVLNASEQPEAFSTAATSTTDDDDEAPPAPRPRSKKADPLLRKLKPYHEQRKLRELERKQRGTWGMLLSRMG